MKNCRACGVPTGKSERYKRTSANCYFCDKNFCVTCVKKINRIHACNKCHREFSFKRVQVTTEMYIPLPGLRA